MYPLVQMVEQLQLLETRKQDLQVTIDSQQKKGTQHLAIILPTLESRLSDMNSQISQFDLQNVAIHSS